MKHLCLSFLVILSFTANSQNTYPTTGNESEIRFKVTNKGNLRINSCGGNKLIVVKNNTGDKVFQLESNGLLRSRRIKVDEDNWADYVFNSDYNLLPLNELEKLILKNKHLPNIPSAQTIKSEGVELYLQKKTNLRLTMVDISSLSKGICFIYSYTKDKNNTNISTFNLRKKS